MNTIDTSNSLTTRGFAHYLRLIGRVPWAFAGTVFFSLVYGLASGFGMPYMVRELFPKLYADESPQGWALVVLVAYLPALFLVRNVSYFFSEFLSGYCGVRILAALRERFFDKLQRLPLAYFGGQKRGDLVTRLMQDTEKIQLGVTKVALHLVRDPATFFAALGALAYLAHQNNQMLYLLLSVGVVPLSILPVRIFGKRLHRRAVETQNQTGGLAEIASENIGAIREVRAFGLEDNQRSRFRERIEKLFTQQLKVVKYSVLTTPLIEYLSSIGVALAIWYSARAGIGLEEVLAMLGALYFSYEPLRRMGQANTFYRQATASIERYEEIMQAPESIEDGSQSKELPSADGHLAFENVFFSYGDGTVLHGINTRLEARKVYALVGPSGAGKSTFANLVPRFHDPVQGRITLDGQDIRGIRLADLRRQIALVSQDPILFNDTIYNNLLLSRPEATMQEVHEAARRAFAHDFIEAFPDGYGTLVGERGARLSGGQKQRIALARAFLRRAPILILDEPTSALDADSEAIVQQAISELVRDRTVLIIAHRFSTIRLADEILVFEAGRLLAQDRHEVLMETCPLYQRLYNQQIL